MNATARRFTQDIPFLLIHMTMLVIPVPCLIQDQTFLRISECRMRCSFRSPWCDFYRFIYRRPPSLCIIGRLAETSRANFMQIWSAKRWSPCASNGASSGRKLQSRDSSARFFIKLISGRRVALAIGSNLHCNRRFRLWVGKILKSLIHARTHDGYGIQRCRMSGRGRQKRRSVWLS